MKIMMLGWELPPYNSGGLGVACFHMAKALADAGADIDFILPQTAPEHKAISFMTVSSANDGTTEPVSMPVIPSAYENTYLADIRSIQNDYINYVRTRVKTHPPGL